MKAQMWKIFSNEKGQIVLKAMALGMAVLSVAVMKPAELPMPILW